MIQNKTLPYVERINILKKELDITKKLNPQNPIDNLILSIAMEDEGRITFRPSL
jgi:hypothetical protein